MDKIKYVIIQAEIAAQANRQHHFWDPIVSEVENVGLAAAEAVRDEVVAIEKEVEKIEEVAGKLQLLIHFIFHDFSFS